MTHDPTTGSVNSRKYFFFLFSGRWKINVSSREGGGDIKGRFCKDLLAI